MPKPQPTFSPEQQRKIGAIIWNAFVAVAPDLLGETRSISRKAAIEVSIDYIDMYGRIKETAAGDQAVIDYMNTWPHPDLVKHCVASGYWTSTRYSN